MITEELYNQIGEFARNTYKNADYYSFMEKLKEEIKEVIENPDDISEYADCIIVLFSACGKRNIPYSELVKTIKEKFEINKNREWYEIKPGIYKHVKK